MGLCQGGGQAQNSPWSEDTCSDGRGARQLERVSLPADHLLLALELQGSSSRAFAGREGGMEGDEGGRERRERRKGGREGGGEGQANQTALRGCRDRTVSAGVRCDLQLVPLLRKPSLFNISSQMFSFLFSFSLKTPLMPPHEKTQQRACLLRRLRL